ncbi:TolC family protein, partial [bacterium]|nr:TolC family protein [bacterium]
MRANLLTWFLTAVILGIICLPVLAVPLTITQSVEIALQENEEIKAVEEKQRQAKYGVMESVGNFLPSVSLSTAYSRAEGGREFNFPIATRA